MTTKSNNTVSSDKNGVKLDAYYDYGRSGVGVMEVCADCGHEADLQSRGEYNICPNCSGAFRKEIPIH